MIPYEVEKERRKKKKKSRRRKKGEKIKKEEKESKRKLVLDGNENKWDCRNESMCTYANWNCFIIIACFVAF